MYLIQCYKDTLTISCANIMKINDIDDIIAVIMNEVSSIASTNNSNKETYNIAPAANPKPTGKYGTKFSININAGIAMIG
mmetsp:Transcript_6998/g.6278  ORF Transcript_6998/g.6278 Transcript_6998/m.6278 type:complete len:80 (+) Transcript_6998:83-322(+)